METIISSWDLTCDRRVLVQVAQACVMLGILVGNILFGQLSDKIGRKKALVASIILESIVGTAAAFSPWFSLFLLLRFVSTIGTGGTMVTSFVLIMELIGMEWRTAMGILYQIPFNIGHLSLALIGYLLPNWRQSQLATSLPVFALISYWYFLPESPRWCIATNRTDEAIEILAKGGKSKEVVTTFVNDHLSHHKEAAATPPKGNFFDLFKTPNLRKKTICISYNWLVCGLCFYGLSQYIGNIGGNLYMNIFYSAILQVPGTLLSITVVKLLGRKTGLIVADLLIGVPCILVALINPTLMEKRILGCVGMFGATLAFTNVYVYAGELFPTVVRNVGVGTASMICRLGSIAAPFVADLSSEWISAFAFGVVALVGAGLCFFLPETLNCDLPETIEDGESFGKKQDSYL